MTLFYSECLWGHFLFCFGFAHCLGSSNIHIWASCLRKFLLTAQQCQTSRDPPRTSLAAATDPGALPQELNPAQRFFTYKKRDPGLSRAWPIAAQRPNPAHCLFLGGIRIKRDFYILSCYISNII